MAEPDFILCDRCGAHAPRDYRVEVCVGRETDAAGDADDIVVTVDLCGRCWQMAFLRFVDRKRHAELIPWVEANKCEKS